MKRTEKPIASAILGGEARCYLWPDKLEVAAQGCGPTTVIPIGHMMRLMVGIRRDLHVVVPAIVVALVCIEGGFFLPYTQARPACFIATAAVGLFACSRWRAFVVLHITYHFGLREVTSYPTNIQVCHFSELRWKSMMYFAESANKYLRSLDQKGSGTTAIRATDADLNDPPHSGVGNGIDSGLDHYEEVVWLQRRNR